MIYVSTGGRNKKSGYQSALEYIEFGITNIELSGGLFLPNQLNYLKKIKHLANFQLHNYFPPPEFPFVLNLASQNEDIRKKSISFVQDALLFSSELGSKSYAIHAGFLIDPMVRELGKGIARQKLFNRKDTLQTFKKSVNYLAKIAANLNIALLIENNVVSKRNIMQFNENPFLMADPTECREIMSDMSDNVKLLIDVAHLKVSANSLCFNPEDMFIQCDPWIYAYHLSDNDGEEDTNERINKDSWFWPFLKKNSNFFTVEVYENDVKSLLDQVFFVKDMLKKIK